MNFLILVVKGFIIGLAKIIPGVSGAVLAISMGIYEKAIYVISNLFKEPLNNFKFLFPLALGIFLSIVVGSRAVIYFISNFYLPTMLLFIGLIIGGMNETIKKIDFKRINKKQLLIIIICFIFVFILSFFGNQNLFITSENVVLQMLLFSIIGFIDAVTMVIPGISGTAIMMILGVYNLLLELLSSLNNINDIIINLNYVISYGLSLIITVFIFSKIMNYLFKKKQTTTYCGIIGFSISSIVLLFLETFKNNYQIIEIIIGLFMLIIGIIISEKLDS